MGVITLAAVGIGLPNWLAIAGLLVASALAGVERHGLTSDAVYWAISNYLVAITATKGTRRNNRVRLVAVVRWCSSIPDERCRGVD